MIRTVDAVLNQRSTAAYLIEHSPTGTNWLLQSGSNPREEKLEMTEMFQMSSNKRIPYARALYLSAIAAVLVACKGADPVPPADNAVATDAAALNQDVPEVVISASRIEPDFNG